MPKRSSKKDLNRTAFDVVRQATGQQQHDQRAEQVTAKVQERADEIKAEKNPAAVALGRLGGLKGRKARAATLTAEQRREIAQRAARKRWKP